MAKWKLTTIFHKNLEAYLQGKRVILNEGGSSSSKTWSVLQILAMIAQNSQQPLLLSVVSESVPHLKRGAIRDFQNLMGEQWDPEAWAASDKLYKIGQSCMEFFSADEPSKLRGGRRDILFLNEANNNAWESYQQLEMRTRICVFLDWNPTSEFWAHERGLTTDPANTFVHSTYKDAAWTLPQSTIQSIEKLKETDPNAWNIYGLGRLGKIEGLVYPFFEQCDELPPGDPFLGLDFGFAGDPAVLTRHVIQKDLLYSEELIYETDLTNQDLCARMREIGITRSDEIFADSAEPKSIEEIHRAGFNIKPAPKGEGSVAFGHQKVRQYKQCWTKASLNCIKEQRNFRYIADKDGKLTEKTTHVYSNGMDSRRYGVIGYLGRMLGIKESLRVGAKESLVGSMR